MAGSKPISLHDLLRAIGDGFRSYVLVFSPLRAPRSALSGVRLLFGLGSFLLSSLVPLLGVLPLFIYLVIKWTIIKHDYS